MSKSKKNRNRNRDRGRQKDNSVKDREPNGRKSRRKLVDMSIVGKEARQRVHGLTPWQSSHQDAGTVRGRLWLRDIISRGQLNAADRYSEIYRRMRRAIEAPPCLEVTEPRGRRDWDAPELDREGYAASATAAIGEYEAHRTALEAHGVVSTVELVALWDIEPREDMYGNLRRGLDLLARRFRV